MTNSSPGITLKSKAVAFAMMIVLAAVAFCAMPLVAHAAVTAPETEKNLYDNGDGTYTLSLSVTGKAESSSHTEVTKANVILVLDTSSSMNSNYTTYNGQRMTRLNAEKHVLTDEDGIIDNLLAQNVAGDPIKSDIIEVAVVDFGRGGTTQQTFTTSDTALKNTVNNLGYTTGTNWQEGLMRAQELAATIKTSQPDEEVYIIFLTDGQPTTWANSYYVGQVETAWTNARGNAREIVTSGYHFYGIFTWGSGGNQHYLSSLVQYAYTGSGNSSTALDPAYAQYFTDATDTEALITALQQITHDITESVGFTNVELEDGTTAMTTSNVKTAAGGEVTNMKYYRGGGSYGTYDPDNGQYGTEWADAPHATVNDEGEVDWDLGNITLEDGVTYTCTFVVWPSQESLDLVADLNNDIVDYDSLTPDQKSQISVSGGKYFLKTNTDYPTVTYSIVTTTTVDGHPVPVVSDPITATITNPEPVGLAEEQLNAKKEWEDTLDPSQREDVGESVTLFLKVDGRDYYVDADGKPLGVTLTEASDWTETDYIAIAPGIMVTSDSPAYDPAAPHVTYGGVTYAIIESGHEYVFEEDETDKHFELTAYTHHPMLVGGVMKDVIFTKDSSGAITGIESMNNMGDTISATNTLKGGINITKKVVDESGAVVQDLNPFTITVTMTDAEGNALPTKTADDGTTQYTIDYRIYYGENNPKYGTEGTSADLPGGRSGHIYVTGTSFEEQIYVGDVIRVVNVEDDTVYTVTETAPTGYEYVSTTYEIAYAGDQAQRKADPDHTVQGNSASYAEVTNKYTYGSLEVSKTVEVESGDEEQAKAAEFEFTFKLYSDNTKATELTGNKYNYTITKADGTTTDGTITEGGTFTLKDGDSIEFKMLPEAAYYEITETAKDGYAVDPATGVASGTIVKNQKAEADFINTYSVMPVSVDPPVKKDITGNEDLYNGGDFTFAITNTEAPQGVTAPMPENTEITNSAEYELTDKPGYYEFGVIEFSKPGTYAYAVAESGYVPGVTNDSQATKTITFTVTDEGDGTLSVSPTTDDAVFEFTNEYKTGELDIAKTVVNEINPDDATKFTFTVEFKDAEGEVVEGDFPYVIGETTGTIASGGTLQLGNGETAKITEIPDGVTYKVTEAEVAGYTTTKTGDAGTIDDEAIATAAFTNTYGVEPTTATPEATKVAKGFELKADQFSFELKDAEGTVLQTKKNAAGGSVTFDAVEYTAPGTYKYTISEVVVEGDDIADDTHVCNVTVTVVDNGNGTLTATLAYDNKDNVFTNTHTDDEKDVFYGTTETSIDGHLVSAGEVLTYTIKYANNTGKVADVTVEDTIPQYTEYNGDASPEAAFADGKLTWTIEGVEPGATGEVTFSVTVSEDAAGQTIVNDADVRDGENESTTNAVTTSIPVKEVTDGDGADIDGEGVQVGDVLTYNVSFTIGEDGKPVTAATVKDAIPAGTEYVPGSATGAWATSIDDSGDTIVWTFEGDEDNPLAAGTYTATFQVRVTEDALALATKTIDNTAIINVNDDPEVNTNTVTNTPETGGLTVSKTIEVPEGYTVDEDAEFTFTVELTDKNGVALEGEYAYSGSKSGKIKNGDKVTLKHGESITIAGLPAGAKYTVTEAKVAGYTPESATLSGTIPADEAASAEAKFVNAYKAEPTEIELKAGKLLKVEPPAYNPPDVTGAYTITIAGNEGAPMPTTTEFKNADGNGTATSFGKISYTKPGEYQYTISESGDVEGVTNGTESYTIRVKVTDQKDGKLKAEIVEGAETTIFTNTYSVTPVTLPTEDRFHVTKDLTGTPLTAGAFEFTLTATDPTDAPMPEKTEASNDADGTVTFDTITYDAPGTYKYTIAEIPGEPGKGYTYDDLTVTVTVVVSDNGKGHLEAAVTYSDDTVFDNTYAAEGKWNPSVTKKLNGRALEAGQFTFELLDEDGNVIDTKTNNASGAVQFDTIEYDQTIFDEDEEADDEEKDAEDEEKAAEEKAADDEAADAADSEADADADEADAADSEAETDADATADDEAEAEADAAAGGEADEAAADEAAADDADVQEPADEPADEPAAADAVSILPQAYADEFDDSKVFAAEASDAPMADDEAAKDDAAEPAAALKAAADDAAADKERTATVKYTIREVKDGQAGYTYDGHEVAVTVTVTDNGDGTLKVEPVYDGDTTFINTYKATGEAAFAATKAVTGATLAAGQFSFQLKGADGAVLQTKTNDASGAVAFDAVAFTEADAGKSIVYQIIEVNDAQAGYTYDGHVATATVTVTDNGDGTLSTSVKYSDGDVASFTNPYKPLATSAPFKAVKKLEGRDLKAGEFTFQLADQGGNVVAEATNAADGTVDFGYIGFDEPGTYTFTATEVKGTDSTITYDTSTKTYKVEVTDEAGQLVAKVTCEGAETATFTNKYTTTPPPTPPYMPATGDSLPIVALVAAAIAAAAACGVALRRRALAVKAERHATHSYYGRKR